MFFRISIIFVALVLPSLARSESEDPVLHQTEDQQLCRALKLEIYRMLAVSSDEAVQRVITRPGVLLNSDGQVRSRAELFDIGLTMGNAPAHTFADALAVASTAVAIAGHADDIGMDQAPVPSTSGMPGRETLDGSLHFLRAYNKEIMVMVVLQSMEQIDDPSNPNFWRLYQFGMESATDEQKDFLVNFINSDEAMRALASSWLGYHVIKAQLERNGAKNISDENLLNFVDYFVRLRIEEALLETHESAAQLYDEKEGYVVPGEDYRVFAALTRIFYAKELASMAQNTRFPKKFRRAISELRDLYRLLHQQNDDFDQMHQVLKRYLDNL